jgi:hypothetical protein
MPGSLKIFKKKVLNNTIVLPPIESGQRLVGYDPTISLSSQGYIYV